MKVIFLDCDGVLNRGGQFKEESILNPKMVEIFKRMLPKTGASVVVSSSWKQSPFLLEKIKTQVCDFIDTTPDIQTTEPTDSTQRRGIEIQDWLDKHDVEHYAIIDDTGTMLESQLPNWFKTLGHIGPTEEIAEEVVKHFNGGMVK